MSKKISEIGNRYERLEDIDCFDPWYMYPDHREDSKCWCEPVLEYEDETGNQVWVHNEIH